LQEEVINNNKIKKAFSKPIYLVKKIIVSYFLLFKCTSKGNVRMFLAYIDSKIKIQNTCSYAILKRSFEFQIKEMKYKHRHRTECVI